MSSRSAAYGGFGPGRFPISVVPSSGATSEINSVPTASPEDHNGNLLHPGNPMLAFGAIAAVAFGLMAFSTSVRVGKTKAGLQIGDTK